MFAVGCATTPPNSGFLKDYSVLKVDPEDNSLLWWEKEGIDWKRYEKSIIDITYNPTGRKLWVIHGNALKK